jgi:hypothetical protein
MAVSAVLLGGLALGACGATNPAPAAVVHGTLNLARPLPAPTPTPFVAYGARHTSSSTRDRSSVRASIAPYLRAPQAKIARPAAVPAVPVAPVTAATTRMEEASAPQDSQLAARSQSSNQATSLASKTDTTRADADRYARRQSRELEGYRGGDVIVITTGTVIIVLLVVLLILLIT